MIGPASHGGTGGGNPMKAIDLFRTRMGREWETCHMVMSQLTGGVWPLAEPLMQKVFTAGGVAGGLAVLSVVGQLTKEVIAGRIPVVTADLELQKIIRDLRTELKQEPKMTEEAWP